MDTDLVFPEGSERSVGRKKALIHWELIKDYMESSDMDADEKIILSEMIAEALKADV